MVNRHKYYKTKYCILFAVVISFTSCPTFQKETKFASDKKPNRQSFREKTSHFKNAIISRNSKGYYGIFKMKFLRPKYMGMCINVSSEIGGEDLGKKMQQEDYELLKPIYDTGTHSLVIYDTEKVLKNVEKIVVEIDVKRPY